MVTYATKVAISYKAMQILKERQKSKGEMMFWRKYQTPEKLMLQQHLHFFMVNYFFASQKHLPPKPLYMHSQNAIIC